MAAARQLEADYAPTLFESLNARRLEARQVAATFIPPPRQYFRLTLNTHTLILGPRGSGKTTLLKMLQSDALEAWNHPDASRARAEIQFTGAFVPADVSWAAQVEALAATRPIPEAGRLLLGQAAFATHILRSLISAMHYRAHPPIDSNLTPHRRVSIKAPAEQELIRGIANAWELPIPIASFDGLRYGLAERITEIGKFTGLIATGIDNENPLRNLPGYLHINFLDAASLAVERFEGYCELPRGLWALLLDELELAPKFIRDQIMDALRSGNPQFLFKISMSPYSEDIRRLDHPFAAMEVHDYEIVNLTYPRKEDSYAFCRGLLASMLERRNMGNISPEEVFGTGEFMTELEEWRTAQTAYRRGTKVHNRLVQLSQQDPSFRDYLQRHELDLNHLDKVDPRRRAADLRKISSIAAVRLAFMNPQPRAGSQRHLRTRRKSAPTYSGATALFAMSEGNPRWFLGIVSHLLPQFDGTRRVRRGAQAAELDRAANIFRALLKTIPAIPSRAGKATGVLELLDIVGTKFASGVLGETFIPEPHLTFTVDSKTNPTILGSLGRALNAGAIVYVPRGQGFDIISNLRGKRFRISYLLAAYYRLPLTLGKSIELSAILGDTVWQPQLFEE